jgi:hypothetical protein
MLLGHAAHTSRLPMIVFRLFLARIQKKHVSAPPPLCFPTVQKKIELCVSQGYEQNKILWCFCALHILSTTI